MPTVSPSPGKTEFVLNAEDEVWIASVLNLIPKAVYGGNKHVLSSEQSEGKGNRNSTKNGLKSKKKLTKKKPKVDRDDDDGEKSELRKRLQERISELRGKRKADNEAAIAVRNNKKRKREETKMERQAEGKKQRRAEKSKQIKEAKNADKAAEQEEANDSDEANEPEADAATLETTRLEGFSEGTKKVKRRKLRGGKLKELQQQLEKATKERELKEQADGNPAPGSKTSAEKNTDDGAEKGIETVMKDRDIEKALAKAQGIEVRDDVKKLKKSIRKVQRKSEKSKEEWAKRVKAVEEERAAKQARREKNLKERKENKGKSGKGKGSKGKSGKSSKSRHRK